MYILAIVTFSVALKPLYYMVIVSIPSEARHEVALSLKKVAQVVAGLNIVNGGMALDNVLCKDDEDKHEQVALGIDFHISLGRTVTIDVSHIDSLVAMLRMKLQLQRRSDSSHFSLLFYACDHYIEYIIIHIKRSLLICKIYIFGRVFLKNSLFVEINYKLVFLSHNSIILNYT